MASGRDRAFSVERTWVVGSTGPRMFSLGFHLQTFPSGLAFHLSGSQFPYLSNGTDLGRVHVEIGSQMYRTCSLVTGFSHYESRGMQDPNSSPETGGTGRAHKPRTAPRVTCRGWRRAPAHPKPASCLPLPCCPSTRPAPRGRKSRQGPSLRKGLLG